MSNSINLFVQFQSIPVKGAECRICQEGIKKGKAYGLVWERQGSLSSHLSVRKIGDCFHKRCLKTHFEESRVCLNCAFPLSNIDLQSTVAETAGSKFRDKPTDPLSDFVKERNWEALRKLSPLDVQSESLEKVLYKTIEDNDIELLEALCCSGCFLDEYNQIWADYLAGVAREEKEGFTKKEEFITVILKANEKLPEEQKALSDSDFCDGFNAAPEDQRFAVLDILLKEIKNPSDSLLKAMFLQCYHSGYHKGISQILEKGRELSLEDRSVAVQNYSAIQDDMERSEQIKLLGALLDNGPIESLELNEAKLAAEDDQEVLEMLKNARVVVAEGCLGESSIQEQENYLS